MSDDVKRYMACDGGVLEVTGGTLVLASEYDRLRLRVKELTQQRDELYQQVQEWISQNASGGWIDDLRIRVEELEKQRNEIYSRLEGWVNENEDSGWIGKLRLRVEELENELAGEKRMYEFCKGFHDIAVKERDLVRYQFNKLATTKFEDSARLDWLEKKCTGASDSERYLPFRVFWGPGYGKGIRSAIDKAMEVDK